MLKTSALFIHTANASRKSGCVNTAAIAFFTDPSISPLCATEPRSTPTQLQRVGQSSKRTASLYRLGCTVQSVLDKASTSSLRDTSSSRCTTAQERPGERHTNSGG